MVVRNLKRSTEFVGRGFYLPNEDGGLEVKKLHLLDFSLLSK